MMTMEFVVVKIHMVPAREGKESERVKGYDIPLSFEIQSEIHDADQVRGREDGTNWKVGVERLFGNFRGLDLFTAGPEFTSARVLDDFNQIFQLTLTEMANKLMK